MFGQPILFTTGSAWRYVSLPSLLLILSLLFLGSSKLANAADESRFRPYGDVRLRMEQDWDSLSGNGTKRDDRLRMRYRLRAGLETRINDQWSATVAARSGPDDSQQFPHTTIVDFDDGPTGPYEFNFDHWYVKYQNNGLEIWAGRNELSEWHQYDLFVYDNVTYLGAGMSYMHALNEGKLTFNLNYFALPVGMRDTAGMGVVSQLGYAQDFAGWGYTIAGGYFGTQADPHDPDGARLLLTENNTRSYQVGSLMLQYRTSAFGQPFSLGADFTSNFKDYADAPLNSFSEFHKDDRDSYILEANWGKTGNKGDWRLSYYYAYLEALSMNSSYNADDWVRWGNANQTRATNMKGSEFRVIYTIRKNMKANARLFFVDAIDLLNAGDTTKEDGKRLRIDFDVSF